MTTIQGYRQPEGKWKSMRAVWDACEAANVAVPAKVREFFHWETPVEKPGLLVVDISAAVTKRADGWDVDLRRLPADVHILRIV